MSFTIRTTKEVEEAAEFITASISGQLKLGKKVLFFIPGGSAINVALKVAELLQNHPHENLTVTLTDERYGPIDHFNSNYFQLIEKGFDLPEARIIPVLIDDDRNITTEKFEAVISRELEEAEYKIGLFGVGTDGHTAGVLPGSAAVNSENLVCSYETPIFSRITITPRVIEKLDEAVVWAQGQDKWSIIESLKSEIEIEKEPAQILKKVPLLTIFTDYKN